MKQIITITQIFLLLNFCTGQSLMKTMLRLPDTGQTMSYTSTFGEDNDYSIYPPYFIINGNGTITDTITGLMWQQVDGGEMTIENATSYCNALILGSFTDWRLPTAHESFSILNHQNSSPALNTSVFTTTSAEYWWTSDRQANDNTKVWATNSGGGIGNHPKSETISAGGTKHFHVRAVRDINTPTTTLNHFTDNGNGTITDNVTNFVWQKLCYTDSLTWENALIYADTLSLNSQLDWRLPNIKELQSLNNETIINPSINTTYFSNIGINKYWSSSTLPNQTNKAWYLYSQFGITTYDVKTTRHKVICVRGTCNLISGIQTNLKETKSSIAFPNPFKTTINCDLKNATNIIEFYSSYGELLYSGKHIEEQDFSSLPAGIYFLKITGKAGFTTKLIKE